MPPKKALRPVLPPVSIQNEYKVRLKKILQEMTSSFEYWIKSEYGENENLIVFDANPIVALEKKLSKLIVQWEKTTDLKIKKLSDWFLKRIAKYVSTSFTNSVSDLEPKRITVKMTMTPEIKNVLKIISYENLNYLNSIPTQYFTKVRGAVMRAASEGRRTGYLVDELKKIKGVTTKKAELIARDQINKATESLTRAKAKDVGITNGTWVHRSGGKTSRPTHVKMDGKSFSLNEGMYDSAVGENIFPGQLPNCFHPDSIITETPFIKKIFRRYYDGILLSIALESGDRIVCTPQHKILGSLGFLAAENYAPGDTIFISTRAHHDNKSVGSFISFKELYTIMVSKGIVENVVTDGDKTVVILDLEEHVKKNVWDTLKDKYDQAGLRPGALDNLLFLLTGQQQISGYTKLGGVNKSRILYTLQNTVPKFLESLTIGEILRVLERADRPSSSIRANVADILSTLANGYDWFLGNKGPVAQTLIGVNYASCFKSHNKEYFNKNPYEYEKNTSPLTLTARSVQVACIGRSEYKGDIYNLETVLGHYTVNNAVVSNCNCTFRPEIPELGE